MSLAVVVAGVTTLGSPIWRRHRLVELRGQPELANGRMDCWAAYLAGQSHALGLPVIDTSDLDPEATADRVEEIAAGRTSEPAPDEPS